ncbi:aminoglycoside phosphotransferase family protein [Nocardioides litoris]|uniref:aminoglycoside phosphotransferase family protein n=1 Tax=Nocardioides litoris TaxID=1926648 RepID=UPI0011239EB0|nr:aminoglycoside phosphotransferase family protein [Nocardioides litoris]
MPAHLVALLDPAAGLVLVGPHDPPRLPVATGSWPTAGDLRAVVGEPSAWPAGPPFPAGPGYVVDPLVARTPVSVPGRRWWPLAGATDLGLPPEAVHGLHAAVHELRVGAPADGRAPWWTPTWAEGTDAWVDAVLAGRGRGERRTGPGVPVKTWSLAAVVRYDVVEPSGRERPVWLKAPCAGFRDEPALTAWVAREAAEVAPEVVGLDEERALLLVEHLEEVAEPLDVAVVAEVARRLAQAQVATVGRLDGLLRAGAPDRGAARTVAGLLRVLPEGTARARLVAHVEELHALGLPPTLVHGDLHVGNLGRRADGTPVAFDWTDACVAHPYLDGRHLATSVERVAGAGAEGAVRDAFVGVWHAAYPHVDHRRAWGLARVVDRAFTLLSYDAIGAALRPQDRLEHTPVRDQLVAELVGPDGIA